MQVVECTRLIRFDAAHRILGHLGKCKYVHGHRYVLEVTFSSDSLNNKGMVIDFDEVKVKLGGWINNNWDHNMILSVDDKKLGDTISQITKQKVFYLPYNPTAENMAIFLYDKICPELFDVSYKCSRIKIYETPNCYAEYKGC